MQQMKKEIKRTPTDAIAIKKDLTCKYCTKINMTVRFRFTNVRLNLQNRSRMLNLQIVWKSYQNKLELGLQLN